MKTKVLFWLLGVAGLSGCAVYPMPADDAYGQAGPAYVTVPAPVYIQGGAVYRHRPAPPPRGRHWHGGHDRERGDRDGDGARNWRDRWPNDGRAR